MKVLLINMDFPPVTNAAASLYYDLGSSLQLLGHSVSVLTSMPLGSPEKADFVTEEINGMKVFRVRRGNFKKTDFFRRGIEWLFIYKKFSKLYKKYLKENPDMIPEVVIVHSPLLTLGYTAHDIVKEFGGTFILNVQDLYPQTAIDLGVLKNKLIIKYFRYLERAIYSKADYLVVHSKRNAKFVSDIDKRNDKIHVIENWVDENFIKPGIKNNYIRKQYSLENKFVISYAGNIGVAQNIKIWVDAMELMKDHKDIVFVLIGDGTEKEYILEYIKEKKLDNIIHINFIPRDKYTDALNMSDIGVVTLKQSIKTPVVPSKMLNIMSCGIPVVATLNENNDTEDIINTAKAGVVVWPCTAEKIKEEVLKIYNNSELKDFYGRNGREYVEKNLSSSAAAKQFEKLFGGDYN